VVWLLTTCSWYLLPYFITYQHPAMVMNGTRVKIAGTFSIQYALLLDCRMKAWRTLSPLNLTCLNHFLSTNLVHIGWVVLLTVFLIKYVIYSLSVVDNHPNGYFWSYWFFLIWNGVCTVDHRNHFTKLHTTTQI